MKSEVKTKRIALYAYFDAKGEVRDFALYYLEKLKEVCGDILVIVNGTISEEGKQKFKSLGVEVLVRKNIGYDFSGWAEGLLGLGWDRVCDYDEFVLCNSSCYGPAGGTFSLLFNRMAKKKADFWGITSYEDKLLAIPYHIQSYFLVFKKIVFQDKNFQTMWSKIPISKTWNDAVEIEKNFTRKIEKLGFSSATLIDCKEGENPFFLIPENLEKGCPLVKRKLFKDTYKELFNIASTDEAARCLDILGRLNFPNTVIIKDLMDSLSPKTIRENLHLTYIVGEHDSKASPKNKLDKKISLIFFATTGSAVEKCANYIRHMPKESSIYIVSGSAKLLEMYKKNMSQDNFQRKDFRLLNNRRKMSLSLVLEYVDIWQSSDYVCIIHDAKLCSYPSVSNLSFTTFYMSNLLSSKEQTEEVIEIFQRVNFLGILIPPPPIISLDGEFVEKQDKFFTPCTIRSSISNKNTNSFTNGMMWVRVEAIHSLLELVSTGKEFQKKIGLSDDLSKTLEFFAFKDGFTTGWILTRQNATVYVDDLYHHVQHCSLPSIFKKKIKLWVKQKSRNNPLLYAGLRTLSKRLGI